MTFDEPAAPSLTPQWTTLDAQQIYDHLTQLATMPAPSYLTKRPPSCSRLPQRTNLPIDIYDSVTSTNTILWQHIHNSTSSSENWSRVAIARQQTAGKGQWGRHWQSSLGGLYLSMALKPNCPVAVAAQITLSVVVGVAIALHTCHLPVWIKWPNDLVIPASALNPALPRDTAQTLYKLGGILTETRLRGNTISHAVVGIGINGANPVPDQGMTVKTLWSCLQPHLDKAQISPLVPTTISLNGIAAIAIWGIFTGWQRWQQQGILPLLADYNTLLSHRGQCIHVKHQGQLIQGVIVGSSPSGHLRLSLNALPSPNQMNLSATDGTLSFLQPSSQEIWLAPGSARLEYHLNSQNQDYYR